MIALPGRFSHAPALACAAPWVWSVCPSCLSGTLLHTRQGPVPPLSEPPRSSVPQTLTFRAALATTGLCLAHVSPPFKHLSSRQEIRLFTSGTKAFIDQLPSLPCSVIPTKSLSQGLLWGNPDGAMIWNSRQS